MPLGFPGDDDSETKDMTLGNSEVTVPESELKETLIVDYKCRLTKQIVKISYVMWSRYWSFELFGKEYQFPHLRDCREFIDNPPKLANPANVFKRQKALKFNQWRSEPPEEVTVTSITALKDYEKNRQYWITHHTKDNKRREMASATSLKAICPENIQLSADLVILHAQKDAINKRIEKAEKAFKPFKPDAV